MINLNGQNLASDTISLAPFGHHQSFISNSQGKTSSKTFRILAIAVGVTLLTIVPTLRTIRGL